jgi:hypothetical protein
MLYFFAQKTNVTTLISFLMHLNFSLPFNWERKKLMSLPWERNLVQQMASIQQLGAQKSMPNAFKMHAYF